MLTLLADVVWPALFLEMRLLAWWVILIGLLIEWPFVRVLTQFPWKKAFIADAAMNAASTILGIFLLPIVGLFVLEPIGEATFYRRFNVGTFNPVTWTATFLVASSPQCRYRVLDVAHRFQAETWSARVLVALRCKLD
jgi:hypothetical protein